MLAWDAGGGTDGCIMVGVLVGGGGGGGVIVGIPLP